MKISTYFIPYFLISGILLTNALADKICAPDLNSSPSPTETQQSLSQRVRQRESKASVKGNAPKSPETPPSARGNTPAKPQNHQEQTSKSSLSNATRQSFNAFKVGREFVRIPDIDDFALLTDKINVNGRKIKEISFYSLTPSIGAGSALSDYEFFIKARTFQEAKPYSQLIRGYTFDREGNITTAEISPDESYEYTYDSKNHPIKVTYQTEGYRGAASYTIRYDISWDNDTPIKLSHKVLDYEGGITDEKPDIETDFSSETTKYIKNLIHYSGSNIRSTGNTYKLMDYSDFFEEVIPVWCKIAYY